MFVREIERGSKYERTKREREMEKMLAEFIPYSIFLLDLKVCKQGKDEKVFWPKWNVYFFEYSCSGCLWTD